MSQLRLLDSPQTRTTSDDYYTPRHVFDRLGLRFDLDVASPPGGSPWVPADHYLTIEDDGLACKWHGRVWMNPPYSRPGPWVARFIEHGHGVALLPWMKSDWCWQLWRTDAAVAMDDRGAWNFTGGSIYSPVFFAAFGDECVEAIGQLGRVR